MVRFCQIFVFLFSVAFNAYSQETLDPLEALKVAEKKIESNSDSAYFLAKTVYIKAKRTGDGYLEALSGKILGKVLFYQGRFNLASEYLLAASEIFQQVDDKKSLAESYLWLGAVNQYALQYPLSLNYYLNAVSIYSDLNNVEGKADTYSWIGHYYEKIFSPDSAVYYQHKSLEMYRSIGDSIPGIANVYDNLGSLYEDQAAYDSAYFYFTKAFYLNQFLNRPNNQIVNLNNIGDIYRKTGRLDSALIIGDSTLNMSRKYNLMYQIRTAYKDISKVYGLLNEFELAYIYLDSSQTIYSEIFSNESAQRIAQLQTAFENDQQEAQIELLQKEQKLNSRLKLALLIALILVSISAIFVWYQLRLKLRNSKKLIEQNEKLTVVEQELLVADLKNSLLNEQNLKNELINKELVEKQLREELSHKSQTLATHTLSLVRKNNFLDSLQDELKRIKKLEKQKAQKAINKLVESINTNFIHEEDWQDFQHVFEEIHIDFFQNLTNQYPDLSATDLRLCALIKLNLDTRDISTIMGISQDSLRVARYRLRKKLHLDKGVSLTTYLITQ